MLAKLHKLFHYASPTEKMLYAKLTRKRIPIRLDLNVTKYCNLRCHYCYVDFDDLKQKDEISAAQWKNFLSEMYQRGTRAVRVMGGEPLIRDDIGDILEHIKRLGMVSEINTNGYFVKKRLEELKLVDSICLSLDGTREANDRLRGEGCHDRVIEAIETAKAHGLVVRLHGIVTNDTLDSLDYLASLSKKYNISFTSAPACLPNVQEDYPELYVEHEALVEYFGRYLELKKQGYPIITSYPAVRHVLQWPFQDRFLHYCGEPWPADAPPYVRCQYGQRSCYIDADGMLYACSTQWKIGLNYFEHGFDACWNYLEEHLTCDTCKTINDFSYAFQLNPSVILEILKEVLRSQS